MAQSVFSGNCQSRANTSDTLGPREVCTECLWSDHGALPENLRTAVNTYKKTQSTFSSAEMIQYFQQNGGGISILPKREFSECVLIVGERNIRLPLRAHCQCSVYYAVCFISVTFQLLLPVPIKLTMSQVTS